ncbi:MAG: VIT family protein [Propionibacteriaceae bacterium]|nr:VIT family protein [Propionibacteriaceae bacterium]
MAKSKSENLSSRLNWLRAGVLGANDGIISTAGIVFGVAGATANSFVIMVSGLASLVAGALSMAGGEYVSVSSQRDTELSASKQKREEFQRDPKARRKALVQSYISKGIPPKIAEEVVQHYSDAAVEEHDLESLGIDVERPVSPWTAAFASLISFTCGSIIPLLVMTLTPVAYRLTATVAAVVVALFITGYLSSRFAKVPWVKPVIRNVLVGFLTMNVTYLVGSMVQGLA